jgi:NAD(P)-dependent dehydrogenase (short-subunit alcohol dehydrogenase family)
MTSKLFDLSGKVAIVTGGNGGIGLGMARGLAEAGADVVIVGRNETKSDAAAAELSRHGVKAISVVADVTDKAAVTAMVERTLRELGRIDILINNAANYETAEFERLTLRQWDAMFASNTRGPFLVSREALKWMRRKRPGNSKIEAKIIHMGSLGGLRPWATHAHYCSSKAALHMLTKVMAKALAPEIAVNAVAPGMIDLGEKSAAAFMKRMAKETPMQRNGRDDEIAAAVLFFATAPQFITGQILAVDGGLGL